MMPCSSWLGTRLGGLTSELVVKAESIHGADHDLFTERAVVNSATFQAFKEQLLTRCWERVMDVAVDTVRANIRRDIHDESMVAQILGDPSPMRSHLDLTFEYATDMIDTNTFSILFILTS